MPAAARRFSLIAVCLAGVLLAGTPARGFELFGICFTGNCEAESDSGFTIIDPTQYSVEFNVVGDDADSVESDVTSASALWNGRDEPVAGSASLISRARGDYRRILAALYNAGRYNGAISIRVEGVEAADIPLGTEYGESASVTVEVDAGTVFSFGQTRIVNQAPKDVPWYDEVELPSEEGFAPGEPALAGKVKRAEELSVRAWRQLGHPKAAVEEKTATAVHPDRQLNVTIRMAPGPRADFGEVSVEGTRDMDPEFVAYMTGIQPGEEYDPDVLERARDRLDRLGVFALRKLEEAEFVTQNGLLPINVLVQEKKLRNISVGATFSSIDGAGLEASWTHRNLFGRAERLKLTGIFGGVGGSNSIRVDEFDYKLGATFTKPGVFTPDIDLVFDAFAKKEFNETFQETSAGASLKFNYYYSKRITASAGVFAKYGEFEDAFGEREFFYAGFDGSFLFDNRDDKLEPTEGFYVEATAQPYYEFEFGNLASRFTLEGRTYYSPNEGDTVLAVRATAGSLVGSPLEQTPPDLLFTTGGGGSVRGYGFKNIGIRDEEGDVTGGRSLLTSSFEVRQKFTESLGAVAFVDAGTVGENAYDAFSGDLKIGVGVGLRYYTGLGAIRLDVAVPLNPDDDDPSFAIYAGIGQAF